MALHRFLDVFQCRSLFSALYHGGFQHITFRVDRTPQILALAVHIEEHFIHLPLQFRECAQLPDAFSSNLKCKHRPEPVSPIACGFVADVDTTLAQKIFDFSQRMRKANLQHHRQADDLRTDFELIESGCFLHDAKLCDLSGSLKQSSSDKTAWIAWGSDNLV